MSDDKIKIFISLPITGRVEEAMTMAKTAKENLVKVFPSAEICTPFEICDGELDKPYHWYMGKDIEKLLQCQLAVQCPGWEESKGCRCESATADIYGIKRLSYDFIRQSTKDFTVPNLHLLKLILQN